MSILICYAPWLFNIVIYLAGTKHCTKGWESVPEEHCNVTQMSAMWVSQITKFSQVTLPFNLKD